MLDYRFERVARTPYSEQWVIETADRPVGRVDLHFTNAKTYGTLVVQQYLVDDEIEELLGAIDERLVTTADEYREDFVVSVWRGDDLGVFAEDSDDEDIEDEVAL
jgi:hypothetical protein